MRTLRVLIGFITFFVAALAEEALYRVPLLGRWLLERRGRRGPRRLVALLERLGGAFIKFGQMFSMRVDLLPAHYCAALSGLFDRVPPFPTEDARRIIEEDLGHPIEELFEAFAPLPIAAATFGQVHHVVLGRGEDKGMRAVIKIRRPEAEEQLARDARLLMWVTWMIDTSSVLGRIKLHPVARDFVRWTRREVNFTLEGKNADRLWEVTEWNTKQRIPHVYWEYTSRRVLTMEYLEGMSVLSLIERFEAGDPTLDDDLAAMGCDRVTLARHIYQNFYLQAFIGKVFHGDPHPGNLIIMPDNVVGYVDFGLLGRMTPEAHEEQIAVIDAVARADMEKLFTAVLDVLDAPRGLLVTDYFDQFSEVADAWLDACDNPGATIKEKSLANFVTSVMDLARNIGLSLSMTTTLFFKALMSVDASILRLAPELDYNVETVKAQRLVKLRQIEKFMSPNATLDRSLDMTLLLLGLPDFLASEITTYKQRTRRMYRKIHQLPLMISRLLKLMALGALLAGLTLLPIELDYVQHEHHLDFLPAALTESLYFAWAIDLSPYWHVFLVAAVAMWWVARVVSNQSLVKVQGEEGG